MNKKELWMRIPVFILSGVILYVWGFFILIFALAQLVLLLVEGKKEKEFAHISFMFSNQIYTFFKYITFLSDERPFPFSKMKK
ncbi:MAG: DUF4389 domain-containing protein [Candidatus Pacearchaeota archaeon]